MTTATKNTQGFEFVDIERLEHFSYEELRDYANYIGELYESLDGGLRHRKPDESYNAGAIFRLLRSRTPYGQWETTLKEMGLVPRSIQRLMYIADGVDEFNLDVEDFSFQDKIIDYIRSLRG
ncbi:MAG: hypothetical protein OXH16_03160 [Gemmatimonadetes bacterium]|nr:hypothetical protein [Gemmatimonadota bacterium]